MLTVCQALCWAGILSCYQLNGWDTQGSGFSLLGTIFFPFAPSYPCPSPALPGRIKVRAGSRPGLPLPGLTAGPEPRAADAQVVNAGESRSKGRSEMTSQSIRGSKSSELTKSSIPNCQDSAKEMQGEDSRNIPKASLVRAQEPLWYFCGCAMWGERPWGAPDKGALLDSFPSCHMALLPRVFVLFLGNFLCRHGRWISVTSPLG